MSTSPMRAEPTQVAPQLYDALQLLHEDSVRFENETEVNFGKVHTRQDAALAALNKWGATLETTLNQNCDDLELAINTNGTLIKNAVTTSGTDVKTAVVASGTDVKAAIAKLEVSTTTSLATINSGIGYLKESGDRHEELLKHIEDLLAKIELNTRTAPII